MPPKNTRTRRTTDTNAPPRAIVYTRLSKEKSSQRATDVGLETQRAGCARAIDALGGVVVGVEHDVVSGDRLDRPGLWSAIERIKAGEADTLIVYSLDRFGRDQVQQAVVVHELRRAGGTLLSATENLADGPLGDLMRSVYGFAGAVEIAKNRERVNRALTAKFPQQRRYKPGRRVIYGYRQVGAGPDAMFEIDEREADVVARLFRERARGASLRAIAAALDADGIASPTGVRWSSGGVRDVLARPVYWTGEHECWKTRTVRDIDGVPANEPRPHAERYVVAFTPLIDAALAERAHATASRNVWKSRRADRPAEIGLLRYGFARCASCGRALSVVDRRDRQTRYSCTNSGDDRRPCSAPAAIPLTEVDGVLWFWVRAVLEDPYRAGAYRVLAADPAPDPAARAALIDAERAIADLEATMAGLIDNLGLLTGVAASLAAEKANALNADLDAARTARDRVAADAARTAVPRSTRDLDAINAAALGAITAMIEADPDATETMTLAPTKALGMRGPARETARDETGARPVTVPATWAAKQAALAALNVSVVVAKRDDAQPSWVAEMRFGDGSMWRATVETSKVGAASYPCGTPRSITP